jgi:hypothetical protein
MPFQLNGYPVPGESKEDFLRRDQQFWFQTGKGYIAGFLTGVAILTLKQAAVSVWRFFLPAAPVAAGAAQKVIDQISQGRSMSAAVQQLNAAGASQAQAISTLIQVVGNASKDLIQGTLAGAPGSAVLSGVQFSAQNGSIVGSATQVIVVAPSGLATMGSAIVSRADLVNNVFEVSNFVAR